MESVSLAIIKQLAKDREVKLRDLAARLPKRTNDHRDYYALASLITGGYVDVWLETPLKKQNEQDIAIRLYMWVVGGGTDFEYRGFRQSGGDFSDLPFFATTKGSLAVDEIRTKRADRLWAFAAAIVTALVASGLGGMVG